MSCVCQATDACPSHTNLIEVLVYWNNTRSGAMYVEV